MLRIAKWHDWQAAPLTKIRGKRKENKVAENAPYAMPKVFVASALDGRFVDFAESVGSNAESYFLRTLQYVALHDPFGGTVNVRREAFGPIVLTRAWDVVGKAKGCLIFDAFLATGIGEIVPQGAPQTTTSGEPDGEPQGVTPGEPDGDASSSSGSSSGSGSILPPTPSGGSGRASASPLTEQERVAIDAGCRAIHADAKATPTLKARAAAVFNGLREGIDPESARAFYKREVLPKTNYRCAALAAKGA